MLDQNFGFEWHPYHIVSLILQFFLMLSCFIAIGVNLSQFICIGRFSAVSFQVLGHMKTVLVLSLGFLFFGKEGLNNLQVIIAMVLDRYSWNDMVWKRIC